MDTLMQAVSDRRPSVPSLQAHIDSVSLSRTSPSYSLSAIPARIASQNQTPTTPEDIAGLSARATSPPPPPAFNNYLRALHSFNPQSGSVSLEDASLMNASMTEGDLILVHCIHANGWADGTVLNTGDRGWLPTNYCEPYDHPYLRVLLNALTQFWDLLGSSEDDNLSTFVRQDYIRGLIAGVRFLLERADCLHRDANQVKKHVGVRRMRKGILADLSSLVQIAKRVQETINQSYAGETISLLLEELIAKAFKVITRAVSFIDVWTLETAEDRGDIGGRNTPSRGAATPSVDLTNSSVAKFHTYTTPTSTSLQLDTGASEASGLSPMIDSAMDMHAEKSIVPAAKPDEVVPPPRHQSRASFNGSLKRASVVFTPPDGHSAHRLSMVRRENTHDESASMASDQLAQTHDLCISHIAGFIGHHLHSRPYSELAATTEKLVTACESMLAVVDEVRAHDPQQGMSVAQAQRDFHAKVHELANSIEEVRQMSGKPDDEVIILPEKSKSLIAIGTELIRNTGNCVVKTRQLIETIGDFELKGPIVPSAKPSSPTARFSHAENTPASPVAVTSSPNKRSSRLIRNSLDAMPPPPPPKDRSTSNASVLGFSPIVALSSERASPDLPEVAEKEPQEVSAWRPPSQPVVSAKHASIVQETPTDSSKGSFSIRSESRTSIRQDSAGYSVTGQSTTSSLETISSSARDSGILTASEVSTRATTPEHPKAAEGDMETATITSFASAGSLHSGHTDGSSDVEVQVLHKTFANELTFNKDGQVTGGSLPALAEQLTTHDSAPDPVFVKAFFLTFREFAQPREVAQALIDRFEYIGDSKAIGHPVRLRIFNIFKHWLETYWHPEADKEALGDIRYFALHKLKVQLPSAGERLVELTRRVAAGYRDGVFVPGLGKIYMPTAQEGRQPEPILSKQELNALRAANAGGTACNILDLNPTEVARQITLLTSRTFCAIQPDELLSMDWGKSDTTKSQNARAMCLVNTDLAHMVGETILAPDDPKKRAAVLKHWCKIAMACLELNNFDSVMGIMCTINNSVVHRLKKTWEHVGKKSRARIDELQKICDVSLNYSALRKAVEASNMPCLPFFGVYLTDLTFLFAGNSRKRDLPPGAAAGSGPADPSRSSVGAAPPPVSVINFDRYMRASRIITHLQHFQKPYHLREVPEMRIWVEGYFARMRDAADTMVTSLHQRSLAVEPKVDEHRRNTHTAVPAPAAPAASAAPVAAASDASAAPAAPLAGAVADERPKTSAGISRTQTVMDRFDFKLMKTGGV